MKQSFKKNMKRVAIENGFSLKQIFSGISDILNNKENIENVDVEELTAEECNVTEDVLKELKKSDTRIVTMETTWGTVPRNIKERNAKKGPLNGKKLEIGKTQGKDIQKETNQIEEHDDEEKTL